MVVTALEKQKKRDNRVSVYIDGKFAFGMSEVDALYYHIKEGAEITQEEYDKILNELIFVKARDKAVRLLGFSQKTQKELMQRLSKDYSNEICERVIELLKKYGYINDEAYSAAFVNDSFKYKGWGSRRIKAELKNRGVSEETITAAVEGAELDEDARAYELLKKRLKGNTSPDYKERAKQYRYLAGRGFSYDVINAAFSALTDNFTED